MFFLTLFFGFAIGSGCVFFYLRGTRKARLALEEANKKLHDAEMVLADILDEEGNVRGKLRLPGELPTKPNRTPCGRLCAHSYFAGDGKKIKMGNNSKIETGEWLCAANQGINAILSRPIFLDENNQCVMFERSNK